MSADKLYEIIRSFGYATSAQSQEMADAIAAAEPMPASEAAIGYISSEAQEQLRVGGSLLTAITHRAITGNSVALFLAAPAAPTDACRSCASKQAKIDALMLEYCPDDITPEQLAAWEASQRPVAATPPSVRDAQPGDVRDAAHSKYGSPELQSLIVIAATTPKEGA